MSSAYGPRISVAQVGNADVTQDDETVVASINVLSTTEATDWLLIDCQVNAAPGADTEGVVLQAYLGGFATGINFAASFASFASIESVTNSFRLLAVYPLGVGVQNALVEITITCTGASADGGVGGGTLVATVF